MFKIDIKSFYLGMTTMYAILWAAQEIFKLIVRWWFDIA